MRYPAKRFLFGKVLSQIKYRKGEGLRGSSLVRHWKGLHRVHSGEQRAFLYPPNF